MIGQAIDYGGKKQSLINKSYARLTCNSHLYYTRTFQQKCLEVHVPSIWDFGLRWWYRRNFCYSGLADES